MIEIIIIAAVVIIVMVVLMAVMHSSMNNTIKNLGQMIAENQKESSEVQDSRLREQNVRLYEINRQFNEAMSGISKSLGEMQNLSDGVDDLKRLMSNVKTRGIIGELQLGAIMEEVLAPSQYEENVAVKGGSERVEFAVRFPGEDGRTVYLPIDSKFPGDAYLNLMDAYDSGDRDYIKSASDGLKNAIFKAARDIRTKYIYPPLTTDFAIMFLPFEGLYAEVLRLNLTDTLQSEYHINIAGPTTMAAMLNSFHLGFRSLALQQRSGEVWDTLEKVKTEFEKFNDVLVKTQMRMDQTQHELETLVGVRTRGIQKALRNVSEMAEEERRP